MVLLAVALAAAAADAREGQFHLFSASPSRSLVPGAEEGARAIDFETGYPWSGRGGADLRSSEQTPWDALVVLPAASASPATTQPKLFTTATTLVTAGAMLGGVIEGMGAPLQYGWESFHTTDERFFGRTTYAGGADKASHFIVSSGVARTLYEAYTYQGHSEDESFALAFAATFMTGAFVEIMDGVSVYGFSFQDLTADVFGTAAGLLIQRNHLEDMLGLRLGPADTDIPAAAIGSSVPTLGRDYSNEIYTADLKIGGLVTRLHGNPGFSRFFLTSFVYFTKGFGYDPPLPTRYQEFGFEVGLNFPEILKEAGVTKETWWGTGLFAIFQFFRVPFTQVGVYYNLHDHKWYGPGAPYHYY